MRQGAFVMSQVQSIREAFAEASSFLAASGAHEPQRSARLLLEHVLGVSGAGFYLALPEPFPPERAEAWQAAVSRRGRGEPAQYIIGEQEFYGRPFEVTPDVLIPRPETELLVEAVLRYAAELLPAGSAGAGSGSAGPDRQTAEDGRGDSGGEGGQGGAGTVGGEGSYGGAGTEDGPSEPLPAPPAVRPLTALDIGAGSGAIAVTLAAESPAWRVLAGDLSPAALAVAARNASRHGAAVELRLGDLLEPFRGLETDILVSNPPYIPGGDLAGLQAEVRDYEPHLALDGGTDGLDPYRRMLEQLPLLARPPRLIGFELGLGQAEAVADLLRAAGHWDEIVTIDDLAGIARHVLGMARG